MEITTMSYPHQKHTENKADDMPGLLDVIFPDVFQAWKMSPHPIVSTTCLVLCTAKVMGGNNRWTLPWNITNSLFKLCSRQTVENNVEKDQQLESDQVLFSLIGDI